jgi:hypothetical protein
MPVEAVSARLAIDSRTGPFYVRLRVGVRQAPTFAHAAA